MTYTTVYKKETPSFLSRVQFTLGVPKTPVTTLGLRVSSDHLVPFHSGHTGDS